MAGGLLLLLDDIATALDDVAVLTKVAMQKTAGVLGDDLALNAQQVNGVDSSREIPVVWAVAKGSLFNKAILVPAAIFLSWIAKWAIAPLLMLGGLYLCFEGSEKLLHRFLHKKDDDKDHSPTPASQLTEEFKHRDIDIDEAWREVDLVAFEKEKIKGAIRTDFVLSAEIIVITLGSVQQASLSTMILVLVAIALIMTIGVYGIVGVIVKLDDAGLLLVQSTGPSWSAKLKRSLGNLLLKGTPYLMRGLSIAGTVAMFLVGGGIILHSMPTLHHLLEHSVEPIQHIGAIGGVLASITTMIAQTLFGIAAGLVVVLVVEVAKKTWSRVRPERQKH